MLHLILQISSVVVLAAFVYAWREDDRRARRAEVQERMEAIHAKSCASCRYGFGHND